MTKRNYMKRLYLLAKWCLPEEEAKEVIQDYQEIVTNIEPEENLVSRLGTPYQAIRPLMPPMKKNIWLFVFLCCVVCLVGAFTDLFLDYHISFGMRIFYFLLFTALLNGCMFYFCGISKTKQYKKIIITFVGITIWNAICICCGYLLMKFQTPMVGRTISNMIIINSVCCVIVGVVALVLCKISTKQWKSIVVLIMGLLCTYGLLHAGITSMNINSMLDFSMMLQNAGIMLVISYGMAVISLC